MPIIEPQQILVPKKVYIGDTAELRCTFNTANPEIKNDTLFAYILMLIKRLPTDEDRNELKKQISVIVNKYSDVIDLGLAGVPKNYKELLSVHNP